MMRILAVVSALALASCQKPFEKHYDLSVDSNAYVLPYTGDTFPVYVYCSGEWTAEFDVEADWMIPTAEKVPEWSALHTGITTTHCVRST